MAGSLVGMWLQSPTPGYPTNIPGWGTKGWGRAPVQ